MYKKVIVVDVTNFKIQPLTHVCHRLGICFSTEKCLPFTISLYKERIFNFFFG